MMNHMIIQLPLNSLWELNSSIFIVWAFIEMYAFGTAHATYCYIPNSLFFGTLLSSSIIIANGTGFSKAFIFSLAR